MTRQARIRTALDERRAADAFRVRRVVENGAGRFLSREGERFCNFSSNDYLGLSQHPQIVRAWQQGADRYGVGSGGSGHVSGYTTAHQALEEELAGWLGYPRALLFISGFAANQAVITALMGKDDRIIADRLSHASLLEAASLSPAQLRRFAHNDASQLNVLLGKPCSGLQLAVTEGYSAWTATARRLPLCMTSQNSRTPWLLVDDAHGIGVTGEEGRGSAHQQRVRPELLVVTFGKGFGVSGAAVLCSEPVADYLVQFARHLIYSTSMPPAQAVALSASLAVIRGEDGAERRARLADHIQRFRRGVSALPYRLTDSHSAIQPVIVGENHRALMLAQALRERGQWVTAIRPPTVPPGTARLRLTLTAAHEPQDIDTLLEALYVSRQ